MVSIVRLSQWTKDILWSYKCRIHSPPMFLLRALLVRFKILGMPSGYLNLARIEFNTSIVVIFNARLHELNISHAISQYATLPNAHVKIPQ